MRENNFSIDYDGSNVYLTVSSHISLALKLFLIICNIVILFAIVLSFLYHMPIVMFAVFVFSSFFIKYSIWKMFGREVLNINTKVLAYRKNYLFIKSPWETKKIAQQLNVISYDIHAYGEQQRIKVILESTTTGQAPQNLYEFSLTLTAEQAEMINYVISLLYLNKITFDYQYPKYSLN